jgi:GntR family transcriptional regulator
VTSVDSGVLLGAGQRPRYSLVAKLLAEQIRQGALEPGDRLPSERELGRRFGASRVTIRRALAVLREQGLIEPSGARGWFLMKGAVGEPNALVSFTEMAAARGLSASAKVIRARTRPADLDEASALRVAPGTELFELERVRLLDDIPVGVDHSRIIAERAPSVNGRDFAVESLYQALELDGVVLIRSEYVIHAEVTTRKLASLLEVQTEIPLLVTNAVTYEQNDRPIELSRTAFLGDRYRFQTTLYRRRMHAMPAVPG